VTVTALLVSHDGARWLPAVLDGLLDQTHAPDRVVAVDTGSTDASIELLTARLGADAVVHAPERTSFPAAVEHGLAVLGPETDETAWVWLLHDDSRPAPDALAQLLDGARRHPSAAILGPKLREWPSLRRLLEVGITISGTGRRETGLERGEYDQGQHDRAREVLAVASAGMLIRRDVLAALGGFDPHLPMFGNDLDLGWRAARAGHRTVVVPGAVMFHVEAAHRGVRRTPVTGSHRRGERAAALYTLLVNSSLAALPFVAGRLLLGSLLRVLGLVLVRAPREAGDELVALVVTLLRPDRVVAGRRARRRTSTVPAREVRHLLAPPWLPYRHGLDFLSDLAAALLHQASDVSSARRAARRVDAESGPVPVEAESLPADTGLLARLLTSRTGAFFAVLVVLALVGMRGVVGGGVLSGGALLPAPDTASTWWALYLESGHETGVGSTTPAAPYLLPLALAGTFLLGKAWLVVDLLFLLCVPLAAWGALRFLRRVTPSRAAAFWGALTYGLLPVLTGAVNQGRLGTVAAALVLPWVAHAALFLGIAHSRDRRWRAAWRTALGLALLGAFVPVAVPIAAVLAVLWLVTARVLAGAAWSLRGTWPPVFAALAAVPVLLLPWSALRFTAPAPGPWYAEAGLTASRLVPDLDSWHVLTGRAADAGAAPGWLTLGITLAAVAALLPRPTRPAVVLCWSVVVVSLAAVWLLDARGDWAGFPILLVSAAAVTAAAVAGAGIGDRLAGRSFGWRQPFGLLVVAAAVLAPVAGAAWWAVTGVTGPLDRAPAHTLPVYMTDAAARDADQGILVVRTADRGLDYTLVRGPGLRLGEESVLTASEVQDDLTALVGDLATAPTGEDIAALSRYGIEFLYLPRPADPTLVGNLDSVSGLTTASSLQRGARAWQLEGDPTREALATHETRWRPGLLTLQALALVAATVLAAPSRRRRR